jgi:CBS domain-containing protein/uncharacterized protein (DUF2267 family)
MSLERFRSERLVVLPPHATAYEAGRAMADNHVGCVLVADASRVRGIVTDRDLALEVVAGDLDPRGTPLRDVMSDEVVTCDVSESLGDVLAILRERGVRRVPLVEGGRPVGLVTLDRLVLEGAIDPTELRSVVRAQLEHGARLKPEGEPAPTQPARPRATPERRRPESRHAARAETTHARFLHAVSQRTGVEDRARAERLVLLVVGRLCERLQPGEARHFLAQLPSKLHAELERHLHGPDRHVTLEALVYEVGRELACDLATAGDMLRAVCDAIAASVSTGEIEAVRGELPQAMKDLFPPPLRRAG